MPRGGKREGAGRPKTVEPEDQQVAITVRVHPSVRDRLQAVCEEFEIPYGEVLLSGIELQERNWRKRTANESARAEAARNRSR